MSFGIETPAKSNAVYAYPNPAKDMMTLINLTNEESIEVYNLMGSKQAIQQERNANGLKINVANLKTGLYFIHVSNTKGETKAIRFIKR